MENVNVLMPIIGEEKSAVDKKIRKKRAISKAPKVIKEKAFDADIEEKLPEILTDYQKRYARDHKMVRGQFTYNEVPGGILKFPFLRYKEDEVVNYTFHDGEVKEIPLMVAEHINQNLHYPIHTHLLDENGKPTTQIGRKVHRASFRSLDFMGENIEARPSLIQISRVR